MVSDNPIYYVGPTTVPHTSSAGKNKDDQPLDTRGREIYRSKRERERENKD